MLSERRNSFLGLWVGIDDFLEWPIAGDPVFRECPLRAENGCFSLGGPMANGICELAARTFLSCGGDDKKHSSVDINIGESKEGPFPNLNGGN